MSMHTHAHAYAFPYRQLAALRARIHRHIPVQSTHSHTCTSVFFKNLGIHVSSNSDNLRNWVLMSFSSPAPARLRSPSV